MNATTSGKRATLEEWIQRLSVDEMPSMYRTALDIAAIASNEELPASTLVTAILKDPGLTARVLTLANSVFHNPGFQPLGTVSRALVVLGFNTIRSICLSVTLVDSLLQGSARDQLLGELARSFHAAVLGRALAVECADESPEEIFIACLLYRLGELSFWCFGGGMRDQLEEKQEQNPQTDPTSFEQKIIGFRLHELSLGLAKKWKLGLLLESALTEHVQQNDRVKIVRMSHEYVRAASASDDPAELKQLTAEMAKFLSLSQVLMSKLLEACVKEGADAARISGAVAAASKISKVVVDESAETTETKEESKFPEYDPILQLTILREISTLLANRSDLNEFLQTVLEGMYRSIGMDRAVFALVNNERHKLSAKFVLGHDSAHLRDRFDIPLSEQEPHIFYSAIEKQNILWAKVGNPAGSPGFIQRRIRELVGSGPFFVAPAVVSGKCIGLFYVDRRISERPLDEASFQSFKHFAQQANLGLDFLSHQHGSKIK